MKKIILLAIFFLSLFEGFAQKGFESKIKKSIGVKPPLVFDEKDGSAVKNNQSYFSSINSLTFKKKVLREDGTNHVIYVENPDFANDQRNARKNINEMSFDFFNSLKSDLGVLEPKEEFSLVSNEKDELGLTHLKFQQKYKNIPLYGGEAILHTNKNGIVSFLTGKVLPTPALSVEPGFDNLAAIRIALNDLGKHTIVQKNGAVSKFLSLDEDQAELMIMHFDNNEKLIYHVTTRPNILERWVYFIDAANGEVLDKYNHTCTLDGVYKTNAKDLNGVTQSINIVQSASTFYMIDATKPMFNQNQSSLPNKPVGVVWTIDAQNSRISSKDMNLAHITSPNGLVWNEKAVSAHSNASYSFDYFLKTFNRNSLNGNGGNIISVINISDDDGKGMDNAYWNGQFMGYGNGRDGFKPLAGSLDVAGHEMTHGVIENTAKLEYRNQSGALNESFADVFGVLIDRNDWTLGEDVVRLSAFPSGALRSLENPNQRGKNDPGYQPKTMAQYVYLKDTPAEDNGGVHVNSGIPNHAFYKFATSSGMNKDKAERVYYRALTTYLTRTSKFVDLRLAVVQSTKDLYGEAQEFAAAKAAFDFVGILDPNAGQSGNSNPNPGGSSENTNIPVNPGTESLVVFDPRPSDQSLYSGPFTTNGDYQKITNGLGCLGKPSVTDDGSFVYFVSKDNHIYRVDPIKRTAPEKLSNSASWRNVAISKDGKLLAALSSTIDDYIYVFNLTNGRNTRFRLYNPTYTIGVSTGEVLYADSFEWDYSGEILIYDAFNRATSGFNNIEYWDVGLIKIWDAAKKDFADGVIEKMFTNLDPGDNIGNPALAKTNSNIFAFDYFNSEDDAFYVITIDLGRSSNNIKLIEENNEIGFPDFSKDDKLLFFNARNGNQNIVKGARLANDKITKVGESTTVFLDAKWVVWFAAGSRVLPTKQAQIISVAAIPDRQPRAVFDISAASDSKLPLNFTLISGDAVLNNNRITLGNTPGKVVLRIFQIGSNLYSPASIDISFCILPPTPNLLDNGQNVTASGGTVYQFYVNNTPRGGQTTNPVFKKDFIGTYSVRNVTSDGCFSPFSNVINAGALSSVPLVENELLISPNPVDDVLNFSLPEDEVLKSGRILDIQGKIVKDLNKNRQTVEDLKPGMYFLNVDTDTKQYKSKFIKK